ncbi:helicase-related protein [Modestobacter sp. SYSU DS0511]
MARLLHADSTAKILVIGESIDELDCVADQLEGLHIGLLNLRGETAKDSHPGLIEEFRSDPNVNVLLGSKVVKRGLNLRFCRHLVSVAFPTTRRVWTRASAASSVREQCRRRSTTG